MQALGSRPSDVIAGIGPAIAAARYQVGPDVHQAVTQAFGPAAAPSSARTRPIPDRWLLDLWAANRHALVEAGVPAPQIHTTSSPHRPPPTLPPPVTAAPAPPQAPATSSATAPPAPAAASPSSPASATPAPEFNGCDSLMTLLGTVPHPSESRPRVPVPVVRRGRGARGADLPVRAGRARVHRAHYAAARARAGTPRPPGPRRGWCSCWRASRTTRPRRRRSSTSARPR